MPVLTCPYCHKGSDFNIGGAIVATKKFERAVAGIGFCKLCEGEVYLHFDAKTQRVLSSFPPPHEVLPEGLSDKVQRAFLEAVTCFKSGAPNGDLCMCRRALDDALDELINEIEAKQRREKLLKGDLPTKLRGLVEADKITPALADWADQARIGGKLAAHGKGGDEWGTPDKEWADATDADEVIEFCISFFEYAFIMKARLAKRRAGKDAKPN
jgi:hypothetical protein